MRDASFVSRQLTDTFHRENRWVLALTLFAVLFLCVDPAFAQQPVNSVTPASLTLNLEPDNAHHYEGSGAASQRHFFDVVGGWSDRRSALEEKGVTFDFYYVTDLLGNPTGGLKQTTAGWGRLRGTMDVDFGKFTPAKGLTFHITGLWQFGSNLGAKIGTIANPSGLVSAHATRLDSWWFQQALFHDKLFLRAGQIGGQDFYGIQQYGAAFIAEPMDYALGNLFSDVYESFDPAGTPAVEIRVVPSPHFYIKSAILAGNRDPYQQDTNGFHLRIANSGVGVSEVGFLVDPQESTKGSSTPQKPYPGLYRVGSVYNGGNFVDPATGLVISGNYLIYFMANQAILRPEVGSNRGLDAFFTYDWSPGDVNKVSTETTAGVRYTGLIPSRDQDSIGLGVIYSKIGDHYNQSLATQGLPVLGSEKMVELNYMFQATPWFVLQPVFQYYVDIGANPRLDNAAVLGFRTKIDF